LASGQSETLGMIHFLEIERTGNVVPNVAVAAGQSDQK